MTGKNDALLEVRGLFTEFDLEHGTIQANADIHISLGAGRTLGIVGESGSGKSVLCRAILRLIPSPPGRISAGEVRFDGTDLLALSEAEMRRVRGTRIKMVFQNPMTSLNPVRRIGEQITEGLRVHYGATKAEAREQGVELLRRVGIPSPETRFAEYPHQWSGGMLQRAVIAMAMAGEPQLLLADEPTTALDVTIQDQILALLIELQERTHMAMLLVSHDLAVVAETCDQVAVMYAGRIMESAATLALFDAPMHPYTVGLMNSIPDIGKAAERLVPISGQPPDLVNLAPGCPFAPRCAHASPDCAVTPITLRDVAPGHQSACLYPERLSRGPA
ncbi:MAG: ABC transporter ATP-binding protein [Alphaproteobacteria bacterium]|jgi:oligopeptide/dipeptide ABC transporter ATP-binding protein|nr:ABC transporter ATP-binding protein [Alphaproteobacteria bacterium]MDP6816753.1 ABC transporter ATP-binding protein [Alphaproteobacteria bacterium]